MMYQPADAGCAVILMFPCTDFNSALALDPTFALAHFNAGIIYLKRKQLNQAISSFNKAVELSPNDESFRINRAIAVLLARTEQEGLEAALQDFDLALKTSPNSTHIFMNRALVHFKMEHWAAAEKDFQSYIGVVVSPRWEHAARCTVVQGVDGGGGELGQQRCSLFVGTCSCALTVLTSAFHVPKPAVSNLRSPTTLLRTLSLARCLASWAVTRRQPKPFRSRPHSQPRWPRRGELVGSAAPRFEVKKFQGLVNRNGFIIWERTTWFYRFCESCVL